MGYLHILEPQVREAVLEKVDDMVLTESRELVVVLNIVDVNRVRRLTF